MSEKRLAVINTALTPRRGVVVAKWEPIRAALGIDAQAVRIFDGERLLAGQIDRIDPQNQAHDELAILLDRDVPPSEHLLRIEAGDADAWKDEVTASPFANGVKLHNAELALWLNRTADLDGTGNWFAGAVTSVVLHNREILDFVASQFSLAHDREKRCMQVDRLRIPRPPWHETPFVEARLFDRSWKIVSTTSGPVRATATIASPAFEFEASPAAGSESERFSCSLCRTIALNAGAQSIRETMWLSISGPTIASDAAFWFSPHYFMYADFGLLASLKQPKPDQLIISADSQPPYGYALAGNTAVDEVRNPPPDFPDRRREHRAFAWRLGFARRVDVLHLFSLDPPQSLGDEIGRLWYEQIYKPLRLEVR